ncbi:MAG TPA: NUDIX domain-containing protein [Thermoanaerobaculia bacterium]|nr:NUDIX domain-containing protein [Thermoanaerobaculia bacterium]
MLQQTTVAAVRKRYDRFLLRFPDVESLSLATEEDVLAAWSGLGYYARARNLRLAAQAIMRNHGGSIPREPAALRRLPGFGPYMAAAVASLAYGARVPAAEANVERVLTRLHALSGLSGSPALRARVLAVADELLPARRPGDLTAALMDLGQTVCTPRRPICPVCPVASACEARRRGDPKRFPQRRKKASPVHVSLAAAVVRRSGRVLLVRRRSSWLDGMWEFPSAEGASPSEARRRLVRRIAPLGLELSSFPAIASARHTVVNRRIEIAVFRAKGDESPGRGRRDARWFRPRELDAAAVPTLTRKIAAAGLGAG